ncbi:MAG: sensor histidine kinase [Ilumatobacter sp.]|uniref:sensor histidine kinase n=1 Tax=Ilumatobacter sp. TaxID=1967498 RepID=UPI003299DEE3
MVANIVRDVWAEPAAPDPPGASRWDTVVVPGLMAVGLAEGLLSSEVAWRAATIAVVVPISVALLWRRTDPLRTAVIVFGAYTVLYGAMLAAGVTSTFVNFGVITLSVYSLVRWASGRDAIIGLSVASVGTGVVGSTGDLRQQDGAIGLPVVFILIVLTGFAVRSMRDRRAAGIREVKMSERNRIARELHDTVAHHVSAIAVQAQGAQEVLSSDPQAAARALAVIEEAASQTLAEMRKMVGVLRDGERPELVPQPGLDDIVRFGQSTGPGPRVDVELSGDLGNLSQTLEAGLFRMVQEGVTNARRHARHATSVAVRVVGRAGDVHLTVSDDGDPSMRSSSGYGLIGMAERASLLGGTFQAGPSPNRGWTIEATLPRAVVST